MKDPLDDNSATDGILVGICLGEDDGNKVGM